MANGLAGKGFDIDLKEGIAQEQSLKNILLGDILVELKSDKKAIETGNVFVEYKQPSGPSGISTTEAEYWAFNLIGLDSIILIKTKRLKVLVKQAYKEGLKAVGGDYNNYYGVLLPLRWIIKG